MTNHYVYNSYEPMGRGYIGSRSCECPIEEDTYMGSYTDLSHFPTQKEILAICNSNEEKLRTEMFFHDFYDVVKNPKFANRAKLTSVGFSVQGTNWWHNPTTGERIHSTECPGENWIRGNGFAGENHFAYGTKWFWNPITNEMRQSGEKPGVEWIEGMRDEVKHKMREKAAGENNQAYGKSWWWNPKTEETLFQQECPGVGWEIGQNSEHREKNRKANEGKNNPMFGKRGEDHPCGGTRWWVNAQGDTIRKENCPGPEWQNGRKWE